MRFGLIRELLLPIAMCAGIICYFAITHVPFLESVKPLVSVGVSYLVPILIFTQLLLTFSRVQWSELRPAPWHGWFILIQMGFVALFTMLLVFLNLDVIWRHILQGALICFISPTGTSSVVFVDKLGGDISRTSTYTLMSNLMTALVVPVLFPIIEKNQDFTLLQSFIKILGKIVPLLICPFILAMLIRYLIPPLHKIVLKISNIAFYLSATGLFIVTGETMRSMIEYKGTITEELALFCVGFLACFIQFYLGNKIGGHYGNLLSGGESLGRKNVVLAIWMAYTYMNPVTSVAAGSYIVWQNCYVSWLLWKHEKSMKLYNDRKI